MSEALLRDVAVVLGVGAAAQWVAWRLRLPSILLLLVGGLAAGPLGGLIDPERVRAGVLLPFISVAVALILYEGGLSLRIAELRHVGAVVRNLVTTGALVTWLVATVAAHQIFRLPAGVAALLGAVLVVTGPTVVGPLLRHLRPTGPVGAVLRWEGIVIDPVGAALAVLVFEALLAGGTAQATTQVAAALTRTIVLGGGLGLLAAAALTVALYRDWLPDYLQNAVSLTAVVGVFALSNSLQPESGLLAVTVMGIALSNQRVADVRHIVEFKENLRVLLLSAIFVVLAARVPLDALAELALPGALFVAVLVVVARPLTVAVATWRSRLTLRERAFLAAVAPRGVVAAAVSSVFALRLEERGVAHGEQLVPIAFLAIIGTVTFYGLAAPWIGRRLGLAQVSPQGVLFVGAQAWVRRVAQLLVERRVPVLLVDTNRRHTAAARMEGLPAYSGSILADYVLDELDLGGLGRLLAVTPNDWVNMLAVQRFERIFGANECYQLAPQGRRARPEHSHLHGRWLFGADVTAAVLERRLASGEVIKATPLTAEFGWAQFRERYGPQALPLMAVDARGRLTIATDEAPLQPTAGQVVIALVREPPAEAPHESAAAAERV